MKEDALQSDHTYMHFFAVGCSMEIMKYKTNTIVSWDLQGKVNVCFNKLTIDQLLRLGKTTCTLASIFSGHGM